MDGIVSGLFAALILIWIAVKFVESIAKSGAKTQRKQAESRAYRLRTQTLQRANEMSAEDLQEFEEWKRQKEERRT